MILTTHYDKKSVDEFALSKQHRILIHRTRITLILTTSISLHMTYSKIETQF